MFSDGHVHDASPCVANAPLSMREMKRMIARLMPASNDDMSDLDAERLRVSRGADMREGLRAFLERRPPMFLGR
jgi:enoyl-CoA hydratase/carnithine racemase